MSRTRNLKPAFFENELLAELPFEYRLLFQGLWCLADREGRLEDRPKRIKAKVFPYDNVDVNKGLSALEELGFVKRYKVDAGRYLEIPSFLKHQNPHCKESASTIPAPGAHCASTVQGDDENSSSRALTLNPQTLTLNPQMDPLPCAESGDSAATERFNPLKVAIPKDLDTPEFRRAWKDWATHRSRIRRPLSETMVGKQFEEFIRYGPSVSAEAIDESIKHGWQGVFPGKIKHGNRTGKATRQRSPGERYSPEAADVRL